VQPLQPKVNNDSRNATSIIQCFQQAILNFLVPMVDPFTVHFLAGEEKAMGSHLNI
jgi:hypothetical protein